MFSPVSESSGDEDALESYAGDPKLYVHPKVLNFNDGKDKPNWPDLPDREDRNVVNNFLKAGKSGSQRESMPYALAFISAHIPARLATIVRVAWWHGKMIFPGTALLWPWSRLRLLVSRTINPLFHEG